MRSGSALYETRGSRTYSEVLLFSYTLLLKELGDCDLNGSRTSSLFLSLRACVRLLGVGELTAVNNIPASLYFFNTKRVD